MERHAVFSPDMRFRYRLTRRWGDGPALPVIGCNPSEAGTERDDPTVRRLIGFARRLGYDAIDLGNCYAFVATYPNDLRAAGYPIGPDNDAQLEQICRWQPRVLCGWGSIAKGLNRPAEVLRMLKAWGCQPVALQINAGGIPAHPSRLAYSRELLEF
jgi:hypothetical protein